MFRRLLSAISIAAILAVLAIALFPVVPALTNKVSADRCASSAGKSKCASVVGRIHDLAEHPSQANARAALYLLTLGAGTIAGRQSSNIDEKIDADLDVALQLTSDGSSSCVLERTLDFARENVDLELSLSALDAIETAAGLDEPISTLITSLALPSPIQLAFDVSKVERLGQFLEVVPLQCFIG